MITPRALVFSLAKARRAQVLACQEVRNFGLLQEYNERKNKKLTNNLLTTDRPNYWITSSRPSNFGDPLDSKTKVDNWFDEKQALERGGSRL